MKILKWILLFLFPFAGLVYAQQKPKEKKKKKQTVTSVTPVPPQPVKAVEPFNPTAYREDADPFAKKNYPWADSVFKSLTPKERTAQLFMVAAYSNKDSKHIAEIDKLVGEYKIGGLIFMQGGPARQALLTNRWQAMAKTPLMLSMDAEWGLAMRLDSVNKFPKQMTLGALPNDSLVYFMGKEIALNCQRIGMQVNFAPVADVNNNPNNPVINTRSFGEDKELVTQRAIAYMRGMQDQHVLATGKHFPGHGDTDTDSHKALPVIKHNRKRLDSLELYPFKKLFKAGLGSVMIAHLSIPALDTAKNVASTLSAKIVKGLLQDELKYKGLIFTDALNMNGVASYFKPGEVDAKALIAGNDMLLFSADVPLALQEIDSALARGEITQEEIDAHCMKILKVKEWTGLNKNRPVVLKNIFEDLNTQQAEKLNRQIKRQAITLVKNENQLPLYGNDKVACLVIGEEKPNVFQQTLARYYGVDNYNLGKSPTKKEITAMLGYLKLYSRVVIGVTNTNIVARKNFGFTDDGIDLAEQIALQNSTSLVVFASPYSVSKVNKIEKFKAVVIAYQDDEETQLEAAQVLAGAYSPKGKLPVSISLAYTKGRGLTYKEEGKIALAHPLELGFNVDKLKKVDALINTGLLEKAYPGCQVLVLKDGKLVYENNAGYTDYTNNQKVTSESIYDLASLTKVLATTLSAMKLYDMGLLDVNATLGSYLDFIPKNSPHATVTIKNAMLHQAGFPAWIPFYKAFIKDEETRNRYFSTTQTETNPWQVADGMYVNNVVKDSIFASILAAKLTPSQGYKYSDIGFYYMREVVEKLAKMPIEQFVADKFYTDMNLQTLGYRPLNRFPKERIVPTEYDNEFRKQMVQGYVHDQGAALLNGVSGHAGLFGNAFDVAAIMQLLLNDGMYGNRRYLKANTVQLFTKTYETNPTKNRRGLGFDKPVREGGNGPTFNGISFKSFGHSGFTGTFAWADPEEDIVYVFLSNRVNPSAENGKLVRMGTRSAIQEAIYEALK